MVATESLKSHGRKSIEDGDKSFRKTVQIATVGEDFDGVLAGLRNAPVNKLVLICYERDKDIAKRVSTKITETLKIDVAVYDTIRPEHSYMGIMQVFSSIVEKTETSMMIFFLT